MEATPNVVLLTVDALRADHLSRRGYDRETTPVVDGLAREGVDVPDAYSASSHTREALPALLTGRYPDACVDDGYHLTGATVASQLAEAGYSTGAFHSNPFASRAYGFDGGFDAFDDDLRLGRHKLLALAQRAIDKLRNRHYAPAETMVDRALSWVETVDGPFFLWTHFMDPHGPYRPPPEYQRRFHGGVVDAKRSQRLYRRAAVEDPSSVTDGERREMVDLYDGEVRYVDDQVGRLLDVLSSRGLMEETVFVLTADHGDAFGEDGFYGHPRRLTDGLLRVPLVVGGPGVPRATVEGPASTLDVVPTVLDVAGMDRGGFPGESLLDLAANPGEAAGRRVFAQARGERDESHLRRYAVRTADGGCELERDVETGEVTAGPDGDESLAPVLREFSADRRGTAVGDAAPGSVDRAVEGRLEALGYR